VYQILYGAQKRCPVYILLRPAGRWAKPLKQKGPGHWVFQFTPTLMAFIHSAPFGFLLEGWFSALFHVYVVDQLLKVAMII
jgi:hypothetical protein